MPRSLTMLVVMPIVGRIYNKVSPRVVVAFGILLFAYTAWLMGHYTLGTTSRGIVNVLIIQGVAFSCLFIPLTTMALSTIPRHRMSDATGLNSLLRQTGGSIGLAVFATMLSRNATRIRDTLVTSVSLSRPEVMARVQAMQRMFMGRGMDQAAAQRTATRMIDLQVRQQAMVISFEKMFMLAGIAFLLVLPLVLLLKAPKSEEGVEVHVEM
jgi:MFS transporter, DHA2 family, multidrug resistance protein